MRSVGAAQAALDLMILRVTDPAKKTFGKYLHEHGQCLISSLAFITPKLVALSSLTSHTGSILQEIARSRADIDSGRLLVLSAALKIDKHQAKGAMKEIAIAKVRFWLLSFTLSPLSPPSSTSSYFFPTSP